MDVQSSWKIIKTKINSEFCLHPLKNIRESSLYNECQLTLEQYWLE